MRLRTLSSLSLLPAVMAGATFLVAQTLSENEIIGQADARIQKYRTGDVELRLVTPDRKGLKEGAPVKIEQTRHSFLFGCNLFMLGKCRSSVQNAAYQKEFSDLFNYATLPFYWWQYEREPSRPNYGDTDRLVAWCTSHHISMKGHPLAWNEGQPSWLLSDLAEVMRLQMQRITDIVRRFKGEIDIWDVVNEATEFDRESTRRGGPTLTAAIRQMGVQGYLRTAFERARAANPQATLVSCHRNKFI
jgi:endo-1,4-beta-xylanase